MFLSGRVSPLTFSFNTTTKVVSFYGGFLHFIITCYMILCHPPCRHVGRPNAGQWWIWLAEGICPAGCRWLSEQHEALWRLICSVQLLSARAGPTSCPNALLDNNDVCVQSERRGGRRGGLHTHRTTDYRKHPRKMSVTAALTSSHVTGEAECQGLSQLRQNVKVKEALQCSAQHQSTSFILYLSRLSSKKYKYLLFFSI